MVYYEKIGKKELKWEVSSDIGKYDNIYKISFKLYNDEGNEKGEIFLSFRTLPFVLDVFLLYIIIQSDYLYFNFSREVRALRF